jgi:hypothetical protein
MKRLVTLAMAGIVSGTAWAAAADQTSIKILEYGIYTAEVEVPRTEAMRPARVRNVCHVMTTLTVPVRDGLRFGFRYVVQGLPFNTPVDIRKIIRFPDDSKPSTPPVSYVTNVEYDRVHIDSVAYLGWVNGTHPGNWTFQIFDKDRKLAEIIFTVVERDAYTIRPDSISTCFPISSIEGTKKWRWI